MGPCYSIDSYKQHTVMCSQCRVYKLEGGGLVINGIMIAAYYNMFVIMWRCNVFSIFEHPWSILGLYLYSFDWGITSSIEFFLSDIKETAFSSTFSQLYTSHQEVF